MAKRMVEFALVMFIRLFGKVGPLLRKFLHFGIIIDIEMVGPKNLPVELRVLDFIVAEVIELRKRREDGSTEKEENDM